MAKIIDRSWRIGCENGDQVNEVWRVIKDAGEPVLERFENYQQWLSLL